MATGFLANGTCYETVALARDAYFSGLPVASHFDAVLQLTITETYQQIAGAWMRVTTQSNPWWSGVQASMPAIDPVYPACLAPSEFFNMGVEVGAAIVGVLVVSYGFYAAIKTL